MENLGSFIVSIGVIVVSSTIHEYAHAWTAYKLGDITPRIMGRLTLNPLRHIDPIGAVSLLIFHFGWSKPVPINPYNFKNPVLGNAIVAAAGPFSNLLQIIVISVISRFLQLFMSPASYLNFIEILVIPFITINSIFMLFNLIPIPPLDGSRIIKIVLPKRARYYWENLDQYGFLILIALMIIPGSPFAFFLDWFLGNGIAFITHISLGA
jgi:Zn-dependent protease